MPDDYFTWSAETFRIDRIFAKPEALRGIRVLELATLILGPATPAYLAEFGAEVIKVELPGVGDTMRSLTPRARFWKNAALGWLSEARNKYHVAIDVRKPEGQALFRSLAAQSDVLVENLRAGTMEEKWGIGYRQLSAINPRLIYVANSGFGQWGPFSRGRASYDAIAQSVSGMAAITGFAERDPLKSGIWIGDYFGALMSAVAVLAALHYRDRTGKGQFIDFAQSENLIRALDWTWVYHGLTGQSRGRHGNCDVAVSPSSFFACRDGMVAIAAPHDEAFRGLCEAMGRPELAEDPRFSTQLERLKEENIAALLKLIAEWASDKARGEVDELGSRYAFAAAPVANAEDHYRDVHLRKRGSVWKLDDPIYGSVVEYGPVPKLSETPGRLKWAGKLVGQDNRLILTRVLGLSPEEIQPLEARGIIGKWSDMIGRKPPEGWTDSEEDSASASPLSPRREAPWPMPTTASVNDPPPWTVWAKAATDPARAFDKPEALEGIRVLDCSYGSLAGCFCSSVLAEFGAEVIRIEPPEGDLARRFTPFGLLHQGTGLGYLVEGRNKHHVTLNLRHPGGQALLRTLAQNADILIETFLPGTMDAWGIGYRQLREVNPRLIYCALSTYGQFGPRAACGKPPAEVVDQALSGVSYFTGESDLDVGPAAYAVPTKQGNWHGWYAGGGYGAFATLLALHHRVLTLEGQLIDVSPAEAAMRFADYNCLWYHAEGKNRERVGNLDMAVFPYTYFRCKDGFAFIAGFSDVNWAALTTIMGRPDLRERYPTIFQRLEHEKEKEIYRELESWATNYSSEEILEMVQNYRGKGVVATGRINEPKETLAEENWWERGVFQRIQDPYYGELLVQNPPWKMTETPPRVKWVCRPVGADNEEIYAKRFGLDSASQKALQAEGVL
ncbi:MAG: CaiB/BaiF CoA transferase family protein [Candidatus Methylomirabilia bacterium]